MMHNLIGHERIVSFFSRCIAEDSLSHAYIFAGPRHVGKMACALEIARTLLHISSDAPCVHPDLLVVEREIDEKKGTLKKDISIEQVRSLIRRFSQSAFMPHGYMVGIIDEADRLSLGASNALLKRLEDSRTKMILILITHDESAIIPTIKSRCQIVQFAPLAVVEMEEGLIRHGVDAPLAHTYAHEALGIPGRALSWVTDVELYEEYGRHKENFLRLVGATFHEKRECIEAFFSDKEDHIATRARIAEILDIWIVVLRDILVARPESGHPLRYVARDIIDRITIGKKQLSRNIHPRLILEHIILHIP